MDEFDSTLPPPAAPAPEAGARKLRGALPSPRYRLASAPRFEPAVTPPASHLVRPRNLSYWLNNQYGDCVTAEEAFAKACYGVMIGDRTVYDFCRRFNLLNGAYLDHVLDLMQRTGFDQDQNTYRDGTARVVNWTRREDMCSAIFTGPVKIGVAADQLEATVRGRSGWVAVNYRRDPNLDHCVALCGYGSMAWLAGKLGAQLPPGVQGADPGYALFTWNTIGIIDVASMLAITGEAWVRNPTTVTVGTHAPSPVVVDTYDDGQVPEPVPTPTPCPEDHAAPAAGRSCWLELLGALLSDVPLSAALEDFLGCLIAGGHLKTRHQTAPRRGHHGGPPAAAPRLGL